MAVLLRDDDEQLTVKDCDLPGVVDGDTEATYTYRPMSEETRKRIVRTHTKKEPNPITHRRDDVVNDEAAAYEMLDYILQGWSGVLFKKSKEPIPCTAEWKRKAIDPQRQAGLFKLAGVNEVAAAEVRAESFRKSA